MSSSFYKTKTPAESFGVIRADLIKIGKAADGDEASVVSNAGLLCYGTPTPYDATDDIASTDIPLSAANLLKGIVYADPAATATTFTLPTAAEIVALLDEPFAGLSFVFSLINTADGDEPLTVTVQSGEGVSIVGNAVVEAYQAAQLNTGASSFLVRVEGIGATPAVVFYRTA